MSETATAVPQAALPRAVLATALALATFMQVLDTTIANVSIPTIAGNLGISANQGTWVITSFAVANGISVPLTGWLMQRFGVVRTFITSVLAFTAASLLCGIAWSMPALVFFRVLQGAVSGPMVPGSQALLLTIFPPERRGTALAIWSMTTLVAPICGPLLGGLISDNYSWPWIFLINVPIGLVCVAVCWTGLRNQETPTRRLPVDTVGLVLLIVWVGTLQIMLDTGKDANWFQSSLIVLEAVVVVVAFAAFLIWELGERHPIVDLSLFRGRNFTLGSIAFASGYAVILGALVLQPLWMQVWLGYTATWAGLIAAPSGVVALLISPFVGRLIGKVDPRFIASTALAAFGVSFFMRAGYTADAGFVAYVLPLLVQGIGMATMFVAMLAIVLDGIPASRLPDASGLSNFTRITSGAFAASFVTTFWDRHATHHQTRLAEVSSVYDPRLQHAVDALNARGLGDLEALDVLTRVLQGQAYLLSALDFFWICGWLSLALIALVWLARRPHGVQPAVNAG